MNIRTRKFIGTVLMIALVVCWALFFMALAQFGVVASAGRFGHFVYYLVAGMGWIIPAGLLIRWMARPDA